MAENFYTILTSIGKSKLANATILSKKVNLKILQVGDGNGTYHEPSEDQTALINKVWESDIGSISVDKVNSNWIVIQTTIPATDGGFYIRETGIFDEEGDLIAVSKVSETYKPVISEGSAKDVSISIVLEVSNVDNITLKIDPNVIVATKNDVEMLEAKMQDANTKISDIEKIKANQSDLDATNANLVMKANDTDSTRTTMLKNVTGAINELNANKANKDGNLQANLDADMLDGLHSSSFAQNFSVGVTDFNNLIQSGMYRFESGNSNCPGGISYGQLLVIHGAGDTITQICFGYSSNIAYIRMGNPSNIGGGGKWTNWNSISVNNIIGITTLLNGWTFWSDSAYGARQITKVGDLCNIDIMVMNSSPNNSPIFIIPEGFRPLKSIVICGVSNSTLIPMDIYLDGNVRVKNTLPASNTWIHINATYPVA